MGSSIRYANNTLGIRLSKRGFERKHYKNVGAPSQAEAAADISGTEAGKFRRALTRDEWAHCSRSASQADRQIITTVLVKSNPTADAAASTPPATPDAAARAAAREARPDDHRPGLHDPVVEGARNAGVERHRAYGSRAHG
jgi:hypothetical protein